MKLPDSYLEKMKTVFGDRFELYLEMLNKPHFRGLRINTLKADILMLKKHFDFLEQPSNFCDDLYVIPEGHQKLGNHPLHHAGAFYLTEPSASAAVTALDVKKGDRVLDLCAAPGGKTVQIAAKLKNEGLLVSNEYVASRTGALVSNVERCGIANCIVTSAHPDTLCERFENYFDKVLVDAPCSGEGMMRKEPAAAENWSQENVLECANRQLKILLSADKALKNGGYMLYSTCTFSYEENEGTVSKFLEQKPDYELCEIKKFGEDGNREFAPNTKNIEFTQHIYPFNNGEGHFVALMRKNGDCDASATVKSVTPKTTAETEAFKQFYKENFNGELKFQVISVGERVYLTPENLDLKGINVVRSGIYAGQLQKNRFIPSHSLYTTPVLQPKSVIDFEFDDARLSSFLHGEEIDCDEKLKGYVALTLCGIPFGFGKASGGRLKNHYPKGLRIMN